MSIPKQIPRQRNFSAGEIDESAMRRDDTELLRAGGRQMSNKRILATGGLEQRPGRNAIWWETEETRTDKIRIAAETVFYFTFGTNSLVIRDSTGTVVFSTVLMPWGAPYNRLTWAAIGNDVVIAYPTKQPQVASWTPNTTTWSVTEFAEAVAPSGRKKTIFYRLGFPGVTMLPSATSGSITVTFSASVNLTSGDAGKRMRYVGRQITLTSILSSSSSNATVNETLFPSQLLTVALGGIDNFQVGDAVTGLTTDATGQVTQIGTALGVVTAASISAAGTGYTAANTLTVLGGTGTAATLTVDTVGGSGEVTTVSVASAGLYTVNPTNPVTVSGGSGSAATFTLTFGTSTQTLTVVCSSMTKFSGSEVLVGPLGSATITSAIDIAPAATTNWDEEIMNLGQGWPGSVFTDQSRLGFCDFPAVPGGIAWSAIGTTNDFEVGSDPDDAIFEIMREKCRVRHVVASDDEFVFTNIGVFYIPISESNPLRPGSVAFRDVTTDAIGDVRPVKAPQGVVFVNDGGNRVIAIVPTGQTARPYITRDVSQYHANLIRTPISLAITSGGGDDYPESYLYIVNTDGTVTVGRFEPAEQWVGFVPWNTTNGDVTWVSALGSEVLFTTTYTNGVVAYLVERLSADVYLDGHILYNAAPALMANGSYGPLWYIRGGTATLIDGTRPMGTRLVTSTTGYLVPLEGDDLTSPTLSVGSAWTEVFEPFVPHVDSGRSTKQTMRRRKLSAIMVVAKHSTGFVVANRRVPPWRQGDNVDEAPPLREESHKFRMLGRSYDPRVEHVKDIPGPCRLIEFTTDVTV